MTRFICIAILCFWLSPAVRGQAPADSTKKVEILSADSLAITLDDQGENRKLFGNVRLKHEGAIMYCDRALQHVDINFIEAYGHVKIVQGDTITVTGDTLHYFSDTRLAIMMGKKAQLKDTNRTLTSTRLEYDMQGGIASYKTPGVTVDKADTLSSKTGFYDTRTKEYTYYQDVKLVNDKYTLTTDTLLFQSLTKWSFFRGNTLIVNKDGQLSGRKGRHNTETGESIFDTRTMVDNESYTLSGDSLYYDEPNQRGYAKGNVEIVAKKDSTVLNGDEAMYRGTEGFSKVFGHAVVKTVLSLDTLFIRADTLYSIENKADSTRKMIADRNVFIFKSDFQGICDSLTYNSADSIINFYKKPVLWGDNSQMEADSVTAWLVNSKVNRMHLRGNSFVISEDTLIKQHNQIKGRTIMAYFNSRSKVERVDVDGNGESIYYAVDDHEAVIGLNRVLCGKMNIRFEEDKVHRIAFLGRPDGKLIPPHEIKAGERQLEGFNWRIAQKPTKAIATWQQATGEAIKKEEKL
ncbi:MAG: hypothetical protein ABS46_16830 [Cytophagaceae bacterium SCN 52-12]|nr:MAG: hypothetical protein ABS46_16830 [Cytophagaceae bacterium SCN 52-12]